MQVSTLRPGLLVSLATRVTGNVTYRREDIIDAKHEEDGTVRSKWETERVIADPEEFEEACKLRQIARGHVSRSCATSSFGLLCPDNKAKQLEEGIKKAQELAAEFNKRAKVTSLSVHVIAGRIAADDLEAVRAINAEVSELMARMEQGVRKLDVAAIRDAAKRAKSIGSMITPEAASRIEAAVDAARSAAREIVKAGEAASIEVNKEALKAIKASRTAFLDLDDAKSVAKPQTKGRSVDLASPSLAKKAKEI